MIEYIHPKIREFIGDLKEDNYRVHVLGQVMGISIKEPSMILLFQQNVDEILCFIRFMGVRYTEREFLKLLNLKSFW